MGAELGPSAWHRGCSVCRAQRAVPAPEAAWLSLPWLIGPAEGLGVFSRAQCQANGAVWLLEQGCSSAGHWPGLARLLTVARLPYLC